MATPQLRLAICGSVDDGKSTLIGRLLYESKQVYEDQLAALATPLKSSGYGAYLLRALEEGIDPR